MTLLHLDWETKSEIDLTKVGTHNYVLHPSTDIWFGCYAFDDEPVEVWFPGQPCPPRVKAHIEAGGNVAAHSGAFEIYVDRYIAAVRYGWPVISAAQMDDTMSRGYAMGLPGKLERLAPALGLDEAKDAAGKRLMLQMCRPREVKPDGTIVWWDEPERVARLVEYGKQDVVTERAAEKRLMPLSDSEQRLWVLDRKINQRGVYVDQDAVRAAIAVVELEQKRLNDALRVLTGGFVSFATETARLVQWLGTQGVQTDGVAKADVLDLLGQPDIPVVVRDALLLRQEAGKSSTAKLKAMELAVSPDGRLREMLQYHGAGTGRWAGRKVQLQNIPRWPHWFDIDTAESAIHTLLTQPTKDAVEHIRFFYGPPLEIISYLLRPMLTAAPGHDLFAADFKAIESRVLAWLAGEEWKVEAHRAYDRKKGPDPYLLLASSSLRKPVEEIDKDERQSRGKVPDLACGYQGGIVAFQKMAKNYGVKVTDAEADTIKTGWRGDHPRTVQYWYDLEDAALTAVLQPGRTTSAGAKGREVRFKVNGSFLWCRLPSGRVLCYPYPKVKPKETPWGAVKDAVHYMTVDRETNKWVETSTYGGSLAENVTQAVARDLLAYAITNAEAAGFPVVLHVHDEVVAEVPRNAGRQLHHFEMLCAETPKWAEGLPVTAEGWRGRMYRK